MSKGIRIFLIIWLIALSLISIAALCRTFYNDVSLSIDYSGILVGILAALCTVLIGWQIYMLVDVKDIDKKFKELEERRYEESLRTASQIYESVSILTTQLATNASKEELLPQSIMFELLLIVTYSRLRQFDLCSSKISNLIQISPTAINVKTEDKKIYIRILSDMQSPDEIPKYTDLITWITNLQVSPNCE